MTARLKPHPAAEIFPMMTEAELASLEENMRLRGQLVKIVLHEGKILDGRNREEVLHRLGRAPDTIEWNDWVVSQGGPIPPPSPVEWVLSMNLERRHLNESQRGLIGARALPLLEAEARKRMSAGGKGKGAPRGAGLPSTTTARNKAELTKYEIPKAAPKKPRRTSEQAAKAVGASSRTVERAKRVIEKRPELADQIAAAKMTLKQAEKAIKREEQHKQVLEYRPPKGTYSVIVTDVPWRYDDELDGSDQARSGVQYPTMSVDEICEMNVGKNLAAPDCALWFWVTTAFLIDGTAARVLAAWGFEPKTMLTWVKDRFGAGRYLRNQTEHCILAVRGKPMITGEATPNVLSAPRRGHSEKPDEFFALVEKVCPAQDRIELFARKEREGWVTSGAELPAPSKKLGAREPVIETAIDPELAARWGREGDAFVCVMQGTPYTVWQMKDSTLWQFARKGFVGGGFTTAEHAMQGAEAHEDGLEPEPEDAADAIRWYAKKHPSVIAIGQAKERRWQIERQKRINDKGKKIGGYAFFWRCEKDSSQLFDSEELAKRDAAQQELLWQSEESMGVATPPAVVDDGTMCGTRPSKNGDGCILKQGHEGIHSNGRTTWRERKRLPRIVDVPAEA